MKRSDVLNELPVQETDFVVEIGAGPTPFRFTKLILEKYPFENTERHGDTKNIAPVLKADAMKLPLQDGSCEVVFASHVLEHLETPEIFLKEVKRCARFVYLEFPTFTRELMYAWSFHHWVIEIEGEKLIFYKNDIPQIFGDFFHANYDFLLDTWSEVRFAELNNHIYVATDALRYEFAEESALEHALRQSAKGEEKVNYRSVYGRDGMGNVSYGGGVMAKLALWALAPERLIRSWNRYLDRRNAGRAQALTGGVLEKLMCLSCGKGPLVFADGTSCEEIACEGCGRRYTKERGLFDFDPQD